MFALFAAVCWFLVAFGVPAPFSLVWLGAALLALHFAVEVPFPRFTRKP